MEEHWLRRDRRWLAWLLAVGVTAEEGIVWRGGLVVEATSIAEFRFYPRLAFWIRRSNDILFGFSFFCPFF